MLYISQSLTFESDKIYFIQNGIENQVMMDWEDEIMSASAAYVTGNGGDILEIGFGMGISAGYIQSHSISSHTIIENHPQIIPRAQEWAADKPNVIIVTGSWYNVLDDLSTYDGIFYDTFGDMDVRYFSSSLSTLIKPETKLTWYNDVSNSGSIEFMTFDNTEYQEFSVSPTENSYFTSNKYYLPKKQF
jgi:protein arginine N-methyltransferase 2